MKETRIIMGMPVAVELIDVHATRDILNSVFDYFSHIDERFSPYKALSEVTKINDRRLKDGQFSQEMRTVLELSEETRRETDGFFDIMHNGRLDPSGLVKGWAIRNAADMLRMAGFKNFYVEAGGDIEVSGKNGSRELWSIGIRNPFDPSQIVKRVRLDNKGIATSGTYIRGQHIYNPKAAGPIIDVVSLTVIGPDIYEADRFATACFAMGKEGIRFIEKLSELEGYMVESDGRATMTSGFEKYVE